MQIIQRIEDVKSRALFTMSGTALQLVESNPTASAALIAPATGTFPVTLSSNQAITFKACGANPIYIHVSDQVSSVYYLHKLMPSDPDAKYLSFSNKVKIYVLGTLGESLEVCVLQ